MFKELLPLVTGRPVTITVAGVEDGKIRLNVVPHPLDRDAKINDKINSSNRDEVASVPESAINALTTPVSILATAEELDTDLPSLLTKYVEQHRTLQQSVDRAAEEIASAVQAVDDRKKLAAAKAKAAKKDEKSAKSEKADKDGATEVSSPAEKNSGQTPLLMEWCQPPEAPKSDAAAKQEGD